jgi:hypothetical protein
MEHRWNEMDREKAQVLEEKPVPMPLCPPEIPHGLTRDRIRTPGPFSEHVQNIGYGEKVIFEFETDTVFLLTCVYFCICDI